MTETTIDLIRHGEPAGGNRYRGNTVDDPLSEYGWTQMWDAVGNHNTWQHIFTSPLKRCHEFALKLGHHLNIKVTVEPRFKEVGFGAWEGLTHDEIKIGRANEYKAFIKDPVNNRPHGAEILNDFILRVSSAYETIIKNHSGKHCLIVTHAGVIRVLIAKTICAAPIGLYRIKITNGGVTRLRHTVESDGTLEFLNGQL